MTALRDISYRYTKAGTRDCALSAKGLIPLDASSYRLGHRQYLQIDYLLTWNA